MSLIAFVIANSIPVIGVYFFDWSVFEFFLAYWFEACVFGIFTFLRILQSRKALPEGKRTLSAQKRKYALFFVPWFGTFLAVFLFFLIFETGVSGLDIYTKDNWGLLIPLVFFFSQYLVKYLQEKREKVFEAMTVQDAMFPAIKWFGTILVILVGSVFVHKGSQGEAYVIVFLVLKFLFEMKRVKKM